MGKDKKFCIKENYISRDSYHHHDDRGQEDGYQDKVYETAYEICLKNSFRKVVDIGCGSGFKLIKYFKDCDFVGIEIEPTLSWLKENYPQHTWKSTTFSQEWEESCDVIICADVIEHLVNPDELVNFIKRSGFKYAVISTPERDAIQRYQRGYTWSGPPDNMAHVREWDFQEFREYMSQHFEVVDQFMSQNKAESAPLCQIVVVKG